MPVKTNKLSKTQKPKLHVAGVVYTSLSYSLPTPHLKFYVRVAPYVQRSHQILSKSVSSSRRRNGPARAHTLTHIYEGDVTVLHFLHSVSAK